MPAKVNYERELYATTVGVDSHPVLKNARGNSVVQGLEIFKAGSFKDSLGDQKTWTTEQLAMMASHFEMLRANDKLPNVPVRVDHSWSVDDVVGYIDALRVVGDRLVADVEFTEPDAYSKFERGTYRSRSLEVGPYETNDGVTYWPVVLGLAFVDLPAVEGLHSKPRLFRHDGKETNVPEIDTFKFSLRGQETSDFARVQAHIAALEGENDSLQATTAALTAENDQLKSFAAEAKRNERHAFVSSLAADKKIAAPQIESMKALVEGLTDEQFDGFKAVYAAAPVLSLLGNHTDGVSNPAGDPSLDETAKEIADLEEIVANFRRAGMPAEKLHETPSFKRLTALKASK